VLPDLGGKGNRIVEGKKPSVVGMVGGVGVGGFAYRGIGQIEAPAGAGGKVVGDDEGEAEVWEGMSEVDDEGSDLESDEEVAVKKVKR
jgi:ribosome biogenesis protein NSA1